MSARQPFFAARSSSGSQGTAQGFNQKTFLIDSSNPLHLTSQAATIPTEESTKIAFNVPGPFSSNGTNSAPQIKPSGLGGLSKKKLAQSLSQSAEKGSLGFLDIRPGTADPYSGVHQDRATALKDQRHQKSSSRSLGLLDGGSIIRPGTAVPQSSRALQDYSSGLDIRAPIPKPAAPASSAFLSQNTFSSQIPENDAHISTTETKSGASHQVDDAGDLSFHSSSIEGAFNKVGPQRVPIEQFGQYNTPDVDHKYSNASMIGHEVTADGRLKMSVTKKRNRDEIEEDGDGSYWVERQAKRHKRHRPEEFETRGYAKSPPFSPRLEKTSSRGSHAEGDVRRHLPDTRKTPRSTTYKERRTTSPDSGHHMPPHESIQVKQAPENTENAFEKLLGRNTNIFAKENIEKYNRMVKKWSECTEEEWIAGAEEIAEKYAKVVSYVKDAMNTKINAYTDIQVDIGRNLSDLGERDQLLDAARKKLVMESANALG